MSESNYTYIVSYYMSESNYTYVVNYYTLRVYLDCGHGEEDNEHDPPVQLELPVDHWPEVAAVQNLVFKRESIQLEYDLVTKTTTRLDLASKSQFYLSVIMKNVCRFRRQLELPVDHWPEIPAVQNLMWTNSEPCQGFHLKAKARVWP